MLLCKARCLMNQMMHPGGKTMNPEFGNCEQYSLKYLGIYFDTKEVIYLVFAGYFRMEIEAKKVKFGMDIP